MEEEGRKRWRRKERRKIKWTIRMLVELLNCVWLVMGWLSVRITIEKADSCSQRLSENRERIYAFLSVYVSVYQCVCLLLSVCMSACLSRSSLTVCWSTLALFPLLSMAMSVSICISMGKSWFLISWAPGQGSVCHFLLMSSLFAYPTLQLPICYSYFFCVSIALKWWAQVQVKSR